SGDRPMIRVLGRLQRVERRGMLGLPFEPGSEPGDRLVFGSAGAFNAEAISSVDALGRGRPAPVPLRRAQPIPAVADRDLLHHVLVSVPSVVELVEPANANTEFTVSTEDTV